jgi:predicted Rossmann fold nucleotide-binding protein DprA/Smf involved in DNA uptake
MQPSEVLAAKIEARITELKTEIAAHERALAALRGRKSAGTSSSPASNGRRAAKQVSRATRPPRRARRPRTASAEAVFDALKDGQDQASAIARQFGVSPAVVRNRLAQLEEAGRVSRTGNRRSTRWRSHAG